MFLKIGSTFFQKFGPSNYSAPFTKIVPNNSAKVVMHICYIIYMEIECARGWNIEY